MDYEKIKTKLLEIQGMMKDIPQECKGMSDTARDNRRKFIEVRIKIQELIDLL